MKVVPIMAIAATIPGPAIILRMPFRKPLANSVPVPSPSKRLLIPSTTPFNGPNIALAIGSNVILPTFSPKRVSSVPVWEIIALRVRFSLALAVLASLVAPIEVFKALP